MASSSSAASAVCTATWEDLPSELVSSIASLLPLDGIVRMTAVCRFWAWSLGRHCPQIASPPPPPPPVALNNWSFPWLFIPSEYGECAGRASFVHIPSRRFFCIHPLPDLVGRHCVGASPDGWIVTLTPSLQVRLLNPLTRERIFLPRLLKRWISAGHHSLDRHYLIVRKIVLTPRLSCGGVAVALYHPMFFHWRGCISFAKQGDLEWTDEIAMAGAADMHTFSFEDAAYREEDGKVYAVTNHGAVYAFDLKMWRCNEGPIECAIFHPMIEFLTYRRRYVNYLVYIVSSNGNLFLIVRDFTSLEQMTLDFVILKYQPYLSLEHQVFLPNGSWTLEKNLKDRSFFLGFNLSTALSANDVPDLRPNCIYFTEEFVPRDYGYAEHDLGVYDVGKRVVEKFFCNGSILKWQPPLWFMPCMSYFPWVKDGNRSKR
ncbi:F-box protein [Apostasia shenzhenica]|uniref:F-box protein n=1 Tax=Apostasia shenzhenica TaxID=1088818 RepID=A0A2H9ZVK1_9ASPA|nr:F-box protein [Apostasia shenzhenica]